MENRYTKTDYQEVVRVGDQKWLMVELQSESFFLFEYHIHYLYIYPEVSSPTWKESPTIKVPIPTQNLNMT